MERKRITGMALVSFVVAFVLTLGVGVPAAQASPCISSITCQPANVTMLVDAGIITAPATGTTTGTVGTVATTASAGGGWFSGIAKFVNSLVSGWNLTQLFDSVFGSVKGAAVQDTAGFDEQTLTVDPDYQFAASTPALTCDNINAQFGFTSSSFIPGGSFPLRASMCPPTISTFMTVKPYNLAYSVTTSDAGRTATFTYQTANYAGNPAYLAVFYGQPGQTAQLTRLNTTAANQPLSSSSGLLTLTAPAGSTIQAIIVVQSTSTTATGFGALVWSIVGNGYVPATSTQQEGQVQRSVKCQDSSGVITQVSAATPPAVMVSGGTLTLPALRCPPGTIAVDSKVTWAPTTGAPLEILPETGVDAAPPTIKELQKRPDCWDGSCIVELERTDGQKCGTVGELCPNWAKDPRAAQNYRCLYGGVAVALEVCSMYRAPEVGVLPNVDRDGHYLPITAPIPPQYGNVVTKPDGETLTPVKDDMNSPVADPSAERQCFPRGWDVINPINWVLQPVKCAIEWAFVPRSSVLEQEAGEIIHAWDQKAPFVLIDTVESWHLTPPVMGCGGVTINVFFLGPMNIMNACPGSVLEPMKFWSRLFGNIAFTVIGVTALSRIVGGVVEFPGLGRD